MCLIFPVSFKARCDMFGGDIAVLAQILQQTIMQLAELKKMLQTGNDTLGLLQDVNRGINDSLRLAESLGVHVAPGIYRDLGSVDAAIGAVEQIYGRAVDSPVAPVQRNTDQTVAEAFAFNNELNDYAQKLDQIGKEIKRDSDIASPGRASKITAASMGVMIHVMNQQLRATGQGLKLQAQALAVQNKSDKDHAAQYLKEGALLKARMMSANPTFRVPRF
jgi:hypothetical protein